MEITFKPTGDEDNAYFIMKNQDQIGEINLTKGTSCIDKNTYLTLNELETIVQFIINNKKQ